MQTFSECLGVTSCDLRTGSQSRDHSLLQVICLTQSCALHCMMGGDFCLAVETLWKQSAYQCCAVCWGGKKLFEWRVVLSAWDRLPDGGVWWIGGFQDGKGQGQFSLPASSLCTQATDWQLSLTCQFLFCVYNKLQGPRLSRTTQWRMQRECFRWRRRCETLTGPSGKRWLSVSGRTSYCESPKW